MDILIKNMEMPSWCGNCQFNQFHEANPWTTWYSCMFLNKDTDDVGNKRLADCPLVALPEHHGRLKDADAMLEKFERIVTPDDLTYTIAHGILKQIIEDAETIVEATE